MVEPNESRGSIQVIERMMSLLDALAAEPEPLALKTLARKTGLHPSTTHRILAVMVNARLVKHHEAGAYSLGIRLLELGNLVKTRIDLRETARPFIRALHEDVGETVNLGIRVGDETVYLERAAGSRSLVRIAYLVGSHAPLHLTSLGKLFLACESAEEIRAYAARTGLPGRTPHSLTSLERLEKELETVRQLDLAYDNEEMEIGLRCLASPIRNDEGDIVAALSISALTDRHSARWVDQLRKTTQDISSALGACRT